MRHAIVASLLLTLAGTAGAQAVYRCGATYSQVPCEGAVRVATAAAVPEADARRAGTQAQRDAKLAADLERARLAQEARAPKAVIPPDRQAEALAAAEAREAREAQARDKARKKPGSKGEQHFSATGPKPASAGTGKKRKAKG